MMNNNMPPLPKTLRDIPRYLKELFGGFFSRLFYIFRLVWDAKPWILFAMLFMSVFNGVRPVIDAKIASLLLTALGDAGVALVNKTEYSFSHIMYYLLFQFGFIFLANILSQAYNMVLRIAGELVTHHIKMKMLYKARTIDLASYDQPEFYEKMENANREAGTRPIQIMRSTFSIISNLITMVSFVAALLAISKTAPLLIIALSLPSAIITFVYRRKNFMYMRRRSKARRQMAYYSNTVTNKDLTKEIRLFDLSDTFIAHYKNTFENYFKGIKKLITDEGAWHIGLAGVSSAVNCYLFLYIARMVYKGILKIGDYSFYTGALKSISSGFTTLIDTTASIYEGTLFIDNMITFMNEEQTVVPRLAEPAHVRRHCGHTIELRNVSFRYPGTERMVIRNVNLTLREGETAVLVGLNGAGKTTLIKLITRLYDPTEGEIFLDGRDIVRYHFL